MVGVVFVRTLKEGKTYQDFWEAWYPEAGFGVPSRVMSGEGILNEREVVTVGIVDVDVADLQQLGERVAAQEAKRHDRIGDVIESTEVRTFFTIEDDSDFSDLPKPVEGSRKGHPWEP